MDMDNDRVDDWLARFSPATGSKPGAFPFTVHKTQAIEARRARMSDLLIFDVLLIRGGIRSPDMLFPPADWASLRNLLDAIDQSAYDMLKKDCLVYILLKWAWDTDPKETNSGWDTRFLHERCIAPQFASLADAYWFLDTGTRLSKAVSILSDARLNRDYVSRILQALALSSSSASFASGTCPATAALVVKYVRTAKPLLIEPDDIDLYALSLAQLSFMDAWAYQKSFPEGSITRDRLLGKLVAWCLTPTPKQEPLAQLLAFSLSSYEQSFLHSFALPSQFASSSSLSSVITHTPSTPSKPPLPSQAVSILQDLLCVRAIQSGDYVGAIKLDRQFSAISLSLGSDSHTSIAASSGLDRKSIIQDLFATLPPAERALLENEIGKVATGVRANASTTTPKQSTSTRRPLVAELSLSASWEDVGANTGSPVRSTSLSSSVVGAGSVDKTTPAPASTIPKAGQSTFSTASPFASRVSQPTFGHQAPPTPKFTAFGSPIPPTSVGTGRGIITERAKMLFSSSGVSAPSLAAKPAARGSLFGTTGSAKNTPNAFFKPPLVPMARMSMDVTGVLGSSSIAKNATQDANTTKQNGQTRAGEREGEDVSMESGSDVEIIQDHSRDGSDEEEKEGEAATDEEDDAGNFLTYDKSGAADLTFHTRRVDETMADGDGAEPGLGFSVFSGSRHAVQNGNASGRGKEGISANEHVSHTSPQRRAPVSPTREGDKSLSPSTGSTRSRAPPGAFHPEEEDEDEDRENENDGAEHEDGEDDHMLPTTPVQSPRRSTRTRRQSETPPRFSTRSQPQHSSKNTTTTGVSGRSSARSGRTSSASNLSHTIPGALMDEDHDEHGQDDADHTDTHGDADTEMDEQEEEDDGIAPLPARSSRRTRRSGLGMSSKSAPSAKPTAPTKAASAAHATKGKARARPSDTKTPTRRSSRLSIASTSPDASPTKGRKSAGPRASVAGSGSGTVATRSSTRRKR